MHHTLAEVEGAIVRLARRLPSPSKRADRIDIGDDGIVITDYKTGNVKPCQPAELGRAARWKPQSPAAASGLTSNVRACAICVRRRAAGSGALDVDHLLARHAGASSG